MRRRSLALGLLALCCTTRAARADGPNLLTNGGYASDLSGWEVLNSGATHVFSRTDAKGRPASGSFKMTLADTHAFRAVLALHQCAAVTSAGSLLLRARFWVNGTAGDQAEIGVGYWSGPHCTGHFTPGPAARGSAKAWTLIGVVGTPPAGTVSADVTFDLHRGSAPSGTLAAYIDDVYLGTGTCAPDARTLCLLDGRFQVIIGSGGVAGQVVPINDVSGAFWFADPLLVDMEARVLDACAVNGHFLVEVVPLTDHGSFGVGVTDTRTGLTKNYANSSSTPFAPVHDVTTFACP